MENPGKVKHEIGYKVLCFKVKKITFSSHVKLALYLLDKGANF